MAEVNELELKNQFGRTWERLLLEYFEVEMWGPSSAKYLLANSFCQDGGSVDVYVELGRSGARSVDFI